MRRRNAKSRDGVRAVGSALLGALRRIDELVKSWPGLATLAALALAAGAWLLPRLASDQSLPSSLMPSAHMALVDTVVKDNVGSYPSHSRLEVILHNTGGRLAVVNRAQVTILKVQALPLCFTQGDLPVSNTYGVLLSASAQPGDVVTIPLHQQLRADEADRFGISLGVESGDGKSLQGVYLFEIEVSLQSDEPEGSLNVGRVLVALPDALIAPVYYLAEGSAEMLNQYYNADGEPAREAWAGPMPCWRSNAAVLRRILAGPAIRSHELEEVEESMVNPTFAAFEGPVG
ncbi:MAG: hypothetical protein ACM3N0_01205 [Chloroflexota bacterium]